MAMANGHGHGHGMAMAMARRHGPWALANVNVGVWWFGLSKRTLDYLGGTSPDSTSFGEVGLRKSRVSGYGLVELGIQMIERMVLWAVEEILENLIFPGWTGFTIF